MRRFAIYAQPDKQYKEPLVFVAPLAITMSIYDLYPYGSLVKHFQHSGFDVYLVDWGQLTYRHCHLNFMAFIQDAIPNCIGLRFLQHAKVEQISLHGWSMAVFLPCFIPPTNNPLILKT